MRMLHRAEVVDLHSSWHNHHAAGMLAGSALDAGTSAASLASSALCIIVPLPSAYFFTKPIPVFSATVAMVPALNTLSLPNRVSVYR